MWSRAEHAPQFVLDYGIEFKTDANSFPRLGKMKECYKNALHLALERPDLIYCEGYALGAVIPVQHAWCCTEDGIVIDPTWESGSDYFGIPFRTEYVMNFSERHMVYDSIIDNYRDRWPLIFNEADRAAALDTRIRR